jgi:hypothetical protein
MDWSEIARSLHLLWERKPAALALMGLGLIVFCVLVVDTWRHKRRLRKRPPPK